MKEGWPSLGENWGFLLRFFIGIHRFLFIDCYIKPAGDSLLRSNTNQQEAGDTPNRYYSTSELATKPNSSICILPT